MQREFIDAKTVAELIGLRSGDAFLRIRARLESEEGFPIPLPTSRRPLLWRRSQIVGWVDAVGRPAADMAPLGSAGPRELMQLAGQPSPAAATRSSPVQAIVPRSPAQKLIEIARAR